MENSALGQGPKEAVNSLSLEASDTQLVKALSNTFCLQC